MEINYKSKPTSKLNNNTITFNKKKNSPDSLSYNIAPYLVMKFFTEIIYFIIKNLF